MIEIRQYNTTIHDKLAGLSIWWCIILRGLSVWGTLKASRRRHWSALKPPKLLKWLILLLLYYESKSESKYKSNTEQRVCVHTPSTNSVQSMFPFHHFQGRRACCWEDNYPINSDSSNPTHELCCIAPKWRQCIINDPLCNTDGSSY